MPSPKEPSIISEAEVQEDRSGFVAIAERLNVSEDGRRFKCWFATPGIVNYEDVPGGGVELVRKETYDEALNSMLGAPLTIDHVRKGESLQDRENGKVDKVYWDPERGWYVCEGTVETDAARQKIREGWGASSGTRVVNLGPAGTWLHNPYDREITKLRFHHLAIVDPSQKPRFEEAEIRLNSAKKPPMTSPKFTWIRKLLGASAGEESRELDPAQKINVDGKDVLLVDLVAHERERNNACHAVAGDDHIEHEGVRYHVGSLVSHYREHLNAGQSMPNTEVGARKEVEDSEVKFHLAEKDLNSAKKAAEEKDATDEHKRHHAECVSRHAAAAERHNRAVQHHQTFMNRPNSVAEAKTVADGLATAATADRTAADTAKTEAEKKEATEEQRNNAVVLGVKADVSARLAVEAKTHLDGLETRDNAAKAEKTEKVQRHRAKADKLDRKAAANKTTAEEVKRDNAASPLVGMHEAKAAYQTAKAANHRAKADEFERLNAAPAKKEDKKDPAAEQEEKDRIASEKLAAEQRTEIERQNAAAALAVKGRESFALLGSARDRPLKVEPAAPMVRNLAAAVARGRELFGSDQGKN